MRRAGRLVAPIVGLVVFFGAWELLVRVFDVRTFVLLRPSTIFSELLHNPGFYWRNTLVTAKEALLGYLVALAVALLWGAIMARSRFLEQASTPVAVLIQVTPIVAYAPSAVLWLGRGLKPIVFITGLICLVPLLFAVTTGLRSADPAALDLMAVVDAPGWEVVRRVRLPYALPYLFSATRTCVGLALIGAVLAEWYALVDQGLGRRIQEAIDFNQSRQLWASIYAVALLGGLAIVLLNVLERRLLHWHASTAHGALAGRANRPATADVSPGETTTLLEQPSRGGEPDAQAGDDQAADRPGRDRPLRGWRPDPRPPAQRQPPQPLAGGGRRGPVHPARLGRTAARRQLSAPAERRSDAAGRRGRAPRPPSTGGAGPCRGRVDVARLLGSGTTFSLGLRGPAGRWHRPTEP